MIEANEETRLLAIAQPVSPPIVKAAIITCILLAVFVCALDSSLVAFLSPAIGSDLGHANLGAALVAAYIGGMHHSKRGLSMPETDRGT